MGDRSVDEAMMRRALALAKRGENGVAPNPMVGAVVLDAAGAVVGEGWHARAGELHAEPIALDQAGDAARGGTLYVTLEPCAHWGRTPPCTERILAAGVRRVLIATRDPHAAAKGGAEILRAAGVHVQTGLLEREARALNRAFFSVVERRRPWVIGKLAMSLDGRIATRTGDSQWITGPEARAHGHGLRAACDAILVGSGTVTADDPRLDARTDPAPEKASVRIILDTAGVVDARARVFDPAVAGPVLIATTPSAPAHVRDAWSAAGAQILVLGHDDAGRVSLPELLGELAKRGINTLLVEGGPTVLGAFFDAALIDEIAAYVAPTLIGGADAPPAIAGRGAAHIADTASLRDVTVTRIGPDVLIRGSLQDIDGTPPPRTPATTQAMR